MDFCIPDTDLDVLFARKEDDLDNKSSNTIDYNLFIEDGNCYDFSRQLSSLDDITSLEESHSSCCRKI